MANKRVAEPKTEESRSGLTKVVLIAALLLVTWNIYKGATVCEIGIPGFTVKFGCRSPGPSGPQPELPGETANIVNGSWQYEMKSSVSGNLYLGGIDLTASGERVSGMIDSPGSPSAEKTAVDGTFVNDSLKLLRPTNQDGVMQEYHLQKQGDRFVGTFQNVGQTSERYRDSGTFQIHR